MANKKILTLAVSAVVGLGVVGGVVVWRNNNDKSDTQVSTTQVQVQETNEVSYQGQEGKNALELLKDNAEVVTKKDPNLGEYVVSINGEDGGGKKYWLYYVDGKQANVGAGEYQTKNGETIDWKLE